VTINFGCDLMVYFNTVYMVISPTYYCVHENTYDCVPKQTVFAICWHVKILKDSSHICQT
jgi:hypothetical protein